MSYKNKYLTLKINKKHYDIFCRLHVVLVRLENKQFVSKCLLVMNLLDMRVNRSMFIHLIAILFLQLLVALSSAVSK